MNDPRYGYQRINVIKAIVVDADGKVLLIQEPETNEWMPGHWGLPGGRPYEKESLLDALNRKVREEVGINVKARGLFKIEELLIHERTVMMYIAVCEIEPEVKPKEGIIYKWVDKSEVEKIDYADFTEFYNKGLLLDYFDNKDKIVPFNFVETRNYYIFSGNSEYQRWYLSGTKKPEP